MTGEASSIQKPETETALYVGAAVSCAIALLPFVNIVVLPSYVLGAMAAVWFAAVARQQTLTIKQAAKLGFLSALLGTAVAAVIFDLIWQVFDYQLWQRQNAQALIAIFRSFASDRTVDAMTLAMSQNEGKSFEWYIILLQMLGNAVFAGLFGAPGGMLARVMFRPKRSTSA